MKGARYVAMPVTEDPFDPDETISDVKDVATEGAPVGEIDEVMIDTLMDTLKDSVGLVGDLFDNFRKRPNEGDGR